MSKKVIPRNPRIARHYQRLALLSLQPLPVECNAAEDIDRLLALSMQ